jgi:photosystem II stability/assembly factor-like uncharacterized protein
MTPEERELRRALDARSGEVTPEFRASLSSALSTEGRPSSNFLPALAAVAAVVLVFATVGVLLLARQARNQPPPAAAAAPTAAATPSPLPPPVTGVLTKPPTPIPGPTQLSAPSDTVLWVLRDVRYLYRSTDRGAHWEQRPMVGDLALEMSFVSDQEGWLTTATVLDTCATERLDVWHTTDAGVTWQSLGSNGISDSLCKTGLYFADSNHGFLAGSVNSQVPAQPAVIYRTSDGGHSWIASAPLAYPPDYKLPPGGTMFVFAPIRAFGSTVLVIVDLNGYGYVYGSTDGGATWAYVAKAPQPGAGLALMTASRWLELIGPESTETTDAGATWHAYPSDWPHAGAMVYVGDSTVGYGVVGGVIYRTVDGGFHWKTIDTPGT